MRFKVIISNGEDGWLVVECPSLPGCVSQGRTVEEALETSRMLYRVAWMCLAIEP